MLQSGIQYNINERIRGYFYKGFNYRIIHYLLEKNHSFRIGFHYLKRKVIPSLGLHRRAYTVNNVDDVLNKAHEEIRNGCTGGENLRKTFAIKYQIQIPRQFAREIVRELDPIGVERRKRRRLRRRQYINRGPNYVWHLDGYDKLASYGVYIHGCIDGFSRRIIWMEAGLTNKKPEVVANYYLDSLEKLKGCPVKIRADCGSENGMVGGFHSSLVDNVDRVVYGPSTSNQRIERWWGILRNCRADYWIDHFKELEADGHFNKGNKIQLMCVQYVYLPLIKIQLSEVVDIWNSHNIRKQNVGDVVSGIPDVLFNNPEILGVVNYLTPVSDADINELRDLCSDFQQHVVLDQDFLVVVNEVIVQHNLNIHVDNFIDARHFYVVLSELLNILLSDIG